MTAAPAPAAPGVRRHARAMAIGFGLGLLSNAFAAPRSDADARVYLAVLLAAIGAIYLGFAVADGRPSAIAVQAVSALVFLNVAFLGVQLDSWYSPFREVADVVIAVPVLAGWI